MMRKRRERECVRKCTFFSPEKKRILDLHNERQRERERERERKQKGFGLSKRNAKLFPVGGEKGKEQEKNLGVFGLSEEERRFFGRFCKKSLVNAARLGAPRKKRKNNPFLRAFIFLGKNKVFFLAASDFVRLQFGKYFFIWSMGP